MLYYFGQPIRFVENRLVEVDVLTGATTSTGGYIGYRTDYSDVEEIVDRKYWQPVSAEVAQVGKHPSSGQSMYDSPELLKSSSVARLNASIRHPSNDIVDTANQLNQLRKITIEVAEADVKAQLAKAEAARLKNSSGTVPDTPSVPPEMTIGG